MLYSAFYRNKAAYIIGKAINGHPELPFAIPVLHDAEGKLFLDTILLDGWRIRCSFSLSRAYFMADMEVPRLRAVPAHDHAKQAALGAVLMMIGLGKQGKTMFYRDFYQHLKHRRTSSSSRRASRAWSCWCSRCPSYPYVFKIIRTSSAVRRKSTARRWSASTSW